MPLDLQSMILLGGLVILVVSSFGALFFIMARESRMGGGHSAHSNDLTNMMILFQTMRDILTQQKDLAREFNISIDKKVNEVRRLVQSNGDVRAELERTKREMTALAARTRTELAALERRLGQVDTDVTAAEEDVGQPEPDPIEEEDFEDEQSPAPIEILPEGPESEDPVDLIDRWTRGMDFDETSAEEEAELETSNGLNGISHDEEVESEDTRAAYRDLLNLQPAEHAELQTSDVLDAGHESNGAHYLTPIQQRVYEYSDAGMRVPEIARELGVGKGEVRLILSLRQDRER